MNLSLAEQFKGFVISIASGILLGAFYDIFRIIRGVFHCEKRTVFFQDLFYMFIASFVTFLVALGVNYGEVRFYILGGEAIGGCIYHLTFGMITLRIFKVIAKILNKLIILPIKYLFSKLSNIILKLLKKIVYNIKNISSNQKKRLKHHHKIVYNCIVNKNKRSGKV